MRLAHAAATSQAYPTILGMAQKAFDMRIFCDSLVYLGVDPTAFQPLVCQMVEAQLMALSDHEMALAASLPVLLSFLS